jgi:hypothetical protein
LSACERDRTGMAEKSSWDQANIRQKLGLVWRNRKKISQIIKDYLYIPFFLLIILCFHLSRREGRDGSPIVVLKCVGRQLQAFLRSIRPEIPKIHTFETMNSQLKKINFTPTFRKKVLFIKN